MQQSRKFRARAKPRTAVRCKTKIRRRIGGELFDPQPWNALLARLGIAQQPELYPAFYPIIPQRANLGFNLNIDFRQDFVSLIFGGATNRWSNVQLAEAISRLVTDRKVTCNSCRKSRTRS